MRSKELVKSWRQVKKVAGGWKLVGGRNVMERGEGLLSSVI